MIRLTMVTIVYTDGACSGNPGPGGWAWAVPDGPFRSGAEPRTTNQRMELKAALEALTDLEGALVVMSDSTYVVNCFRDRWYEGWLRRGWKTTAGKPVANRDLWEPLLELALARGVARGADSGGIDFRWVKGHGSDPMNDVVDRLAVEAALTQEGRRGERTPAPADLGPSDLPGGRDARLPEGRFVLVTGHRPPELGGYEPDNPVATEVRRRLAEILAAKRELQPDVLAVTGLQLGAEQLGAEAAADAGVPYLAVLPYPQPDGQWPDPARQRFKELLRGATAAVQLERTVPANRQRAGGSLARRDGWLAGQVDEAVVVWDGRDQNVGKLVRKLQGRLGEENVWIVDVPASSANSTH
ncbi:MAG: SLOG family protein [Acidimicrobiales bacterium]